MKNNNEISEQRYKETSRYLYDLSEGRASVTYPCLVSGVSAREWNQCLSSYGFGLTNDSVAYDKKMDRGMHEWSANLRDAEKEYGVGIVMNAFRICLVGAARGPHIWNITDVLGREETLRRVRTALEKLS